MNIIELANVDHALDITTVKLIVESTTESTEAATVVIDYSQDDAVFTVKEFNPVGRVYAAHEALRIVLEAINDAFDDDCETIADCFTNEDNEIVSLCC